MNPVLRNRLKGTLLILLAVALGGGLGFLRLKSHLKFRFPIHDRLSIYAPSGLLDRALLDEFTKAARVSIELSEFPLTSQILDTLKKLPDLPGSHDPDLVILRNDQIDEAFTLGLLQSIRSLHVDPSASVANDFRDLPGLQHGSDVQPLLWGFWGVSGERLCNSSDVGSPRPLVFVLPKSPQALAVALGCQLDVKNKSSEDLNTEVERLLHRSQLSDSEFHAAQTTKPTADAVRNQIRVTSQGELAFADSQTKLQPVRGEFLFWELEAAMTDLASRKKSRSKLVEKFLQFINRPESALSMINSFHEASTNRLIESQSVDPRLKPSYFRKVPLTSIAVHTDPNVNTARWTALLQ